MPERRTLPAWKVLPPSLVVMARPGALGAPSNVSPLDAPLRSILRKHGGALVPAFDPRAHGRPVQVESAVRGAGRLQLFYNVTAPRERLEDLSGELREHDDVAAAFMKPPVYPASFNQESLLPLADAPPTSTADFSDRQGYMAPAPEGVDARYAWTKPGGGGEGIQIIDVEGAWQFTHEDLQGNHGGLSGGDANDDVHWRNHGTAVMGVFSGNRNGFGVVGIAPEAQVRAVSRFGIGTAKAIQLAADLLNPGDVLLIELHQPGPRFTFGEPSGQAGFIAVEWWPDVHAAIQYAVGKGVTVVEAAGNGSEDLDDALYDQGPAAPWGPFPDGWANPFRGGGADSGAILVGAGAPPPGTHDRDHGPDRSRLGFSNFGSRVDAQGWGEEVTTCGYGTLQGGDSEDLWYTDQFSGTSSASPIVVGAVACVQGVLRAAGKTQLAPIAMRGLLRTLGSSQTARASEAVLERIGMRPDLRAMLDAMGA